MAADLDWSITAGDENYQLLQRTAIDGDGNVYAAIQNRGVVDIAPNESFGDDRDILTSPIGEKRLAFAKFNSAGELQWVHQTEPTDTGASGNPNVWQLNAEGNGLYVSGMLQGEWDFAPDAATGIGVIDEGTGSKNFLLRLDATTGDFQWQLNEGETSDPATNHAFTVASDGTAFLALSAQHDYGQMQFAGLPFSNSEAFEDFSVLFQISSSGIIERTQRIGSYRDFQLNDIAVDDSDPDPNQWQLKATGSSVSTIYLGDASEVALETTLGHPPTSGDDQHLFAFGIGVDGSFDWGSVYETSGNQAGHAIEVTDSGRVFINAVAEPGSGTVNLGAGLSLTESGPFVVGFSPDGVASAVQNIDVEFLSTFGDSLVVNAEVTEATPFLDKWLDPSLGGNEFVVEIDSGLGSATGLAIHDTVNAALKRLNATSLIAAGTFADMNRLPNGAVETSNGSRDLFLQRFDLVPINLPDAPLEPVTEVLFEDSFEVGSSSNDWDSKWVEDSQNDWFRSTQRATDGSRSAEVDGYANNASLTMAGGVDLTGYDSAELTFDWLIESSVDSGEYLALDFWNGSSWTETARLSGNADTENTWHSETIAVSASDMHSDFKFRFRGTMSRSNEDANVDNVRLTGSSQPAEPNSPPIAHAGGDYSVAEGSPVTLDGSGSTDSDGTIASYSWDFDGDGVYDDANGVHPVFQTSDSGVYTVGLQVIDDRGDSAVATTLVTVTNVAPVADAGGSYNLELGQTATLDGSGSSDPGNDIVEYAWDLDGDGVYETLGATVEYTPSTTGNFTIGLQVTDADGAISSTTAIVEVSEPQVSNGPNLSHGVFAANTTWQTVNLSRSYDSMVVVATPRYNAGSGPGVARIRNANGNSFEVMVAEVGTTPFSGDIHYVVVEEGVYDEPEFKLEAVKVDVAETSGKSGGWKIGSSGYQQSYTSPVVVGQVMSANDAHWSVFWSSSSSRTSPATSSALNIGKHVGEDSLTTRASETVGYLVIEATQNGTIEGLPFVAGVGGDTVRGVGNGSFQYAYDAMPNAKTAVLSSAGMDGGDGGWPVLMGSNPVPASGGTIDLSIDEDQLSDSERNHTTEQVAYFVIDPPADNASELETTDSRQGFAIPNPLDVNGDGVASPIDALLLINHLNSNAEMDEGDLVLDTNGDGQLTPIDALLVVNHLNSRAEGEAATALLNAPSTAVDCYFASLSEDEKDSWGLL